MWMDIAVILIFTLSTTSGFRQGFVRTFIHSAGWILSILLGFIFHNFAYDFLHNSTNYYDMIYAKVSERVALEGSYAAGSFISDMPAILHNIIEPIRNSVATAIATGISDLILKFMAFAFVVILMRLILWIFTFIFNKKRNKGLLGFFDGFLGFILGIFKSLIVIFLLLAFLVPFVGLAKGDFFVQTLDSSKIAGVLYDNNYLLLIIKNAFK